ncbi:MAG: Bestrophin, RFP-TM, chloride channel-domain-containing protein [Monoraphidium minutum]|nr:MAG: Bestrophin, RFP-TM, chloride channel-domain-containing protein [Monoraphidium minutum]
MELPTTSGEGPGCGTLVYVRSHKESVHDVGLRKMLRSAVRQMFGRPDQGRCKTLADQWALHRSPWRWLSIGVFGGFGQPCNVLPRILPPVAFLTAIYLILVTAEVRRPGAVDPTNVFKSTFQMTSFVISLLLAWKVRRVAERWWAARSSFAGVGNGVTAIMRFAATYLDDPILLRQYEHWLVAWHLSVLQLVTGQTQVTDPRVKKLLDSDELIAYDSTNKPRLLAGAAVGVLVAKSGFDPQQRQTMEELIQATTKEHGVPVRIKLQAPLYAVTAYTTHVIFLWLLVLPLGLGGALPGPDGGRAPGALWWEAAAAVLLSVILLGVDEVCNQLEDPFWAMPLEAIVATTIRDVPRVNKEVQALKQLVDRKTAAAAGSNNGGKPPPPPAAAGPAAVVEARPAGARWA